MLPNPLVRAVIRFGQEDEAGLASNLFHLRAEVEPDGIDKDLIVFIGDLYDKTQQVPKYALVQAFFTKLRDDGDGRGMAGLVRVEEVEQAALPFITGNEFRVELDTYKQDVLKETLSQMLLEVSNILSTGVARTKVVNGQRQNITLQGPEPALSYVEDTIATLNTRLRRGAIEGSFAKDGAELLRDYEHRKANPQLQYGVLSGIEKIDAVHKGIGAGELALVLGFVGHLKSTFCLNWAYKASHWYGHNVAVVSAETPIKKMRDALYVMHAAHKKFEGQAGFLSIDYEKVKSGLLTPDEEKFFREVVDDFTTCKDYGEIFYREPEEQITINGVQRWAEAKHRVKPISLIYIDYLGLLDPGTRMKGMENFSALNMVVRQSKLMAMAFAQGTGVAVLSPFQANREGLKEAEKNGGKYSLRAFAGANEAERSMDLGYYVYLDDALRNAKEVAVGNLKTRDVPLVVDQMRCYADPATRVIDNLNLTSSAQTPVDIT